MSPQRADRGTAQLGAAAKATTIGTVNEIVIFANPISGSGQGKHIAERVRVALRRAGYLVRVFLDRPSAADVQACCTGPNHRCVIVIGGDGTVRSVVSLMMNDAALERIPPILVIPMGTANLLGVHLGIRWKARDVVPQVLDAVQQLRVMELDAASANGRPFLIVGGVGLDAAVVHELERIRTGPIAKYSYLVPTAIALAQSPFHAVTVKVDGHVLINHTPAMVLVGNIPEYGTGFPILTHAKPDDGLLDVCVLPCEHVGHAVRWFLLATVGEHLRDERVRYGKGRHIEIQAQQPTPVQIDGEAAGFTPVDISILDRRIPFVLPAR